LDCLATTPLAGAQITGRLPELFAALSGTDAG
jgi:hypothetical protein